MTGVPQLILVVLDNDGDALLRQIELDRANGAMPIPIVSVTRNHELRTKLTAFEQGVDDVLNAPISPEELLARVVEIMRRTYGQTCRLKHIVLHRELEIDIVNHRVRLGKSKVHLTDSEQSLLYLLAGNSGEVVTSEDILATIWGVDDAKTDFVDRFVVSLRSKLKNGWAESRFIASNPGVGYRFLPVVEQLVIASEAL